SQAATASAAVSRVRRPALLALVTLVPLVWLLTVTMTAGLEKIFHRDPRIGFLSQAELLAKSQPALDKALAEAVAGADPTAIETAKEASRTNAVRRFNNLLDAAVAGVFLNLVAAILT